MPCSNQFEWTAVTTADRMWCSIAFDAFRSETQKDPLANLTSMINFVFKRRLRANVLALDDSFGYPTWLQSNPPGGDSI